jgi:heat shock protein HtpX
MSRLKTVLLLGALTGLLLFLGNVIGGESGLVLALGLAGVMNVGAWWFSDRIVLAMHHAREVTEADAPRLHAIASELSARAGIPKPRVFIVQDPSPNAFATGRNPAHGVVAVTTGIMSILDENELRGVLAHELGHIKNRDTLISTVAATMAGAISYLTHILFFFGGGGSSDDRRGNPLASLALLILSPIIAAILQMALSRTREFRADDFGAELAGSGEPLARALLKLERASGRVRPTAMQPEFAPLYIVHPFSTRGLSRVFSTHPSTEDRVRRLMKRSPGIAAFWNPQEV